MSIIFLLAEPPLRIVIPFSPPIVNSVPTGTFQPPGTSAFLVPETVIFAPSTNIRSFPFTTSITPPASTIRPVPLLYIVTFVMSVWSADWPSPVSGVSMPYS